MRVTLIESPGRSPLVTARTGYSTAANLDNRKTTGDVRSCESAASEAAAPRSLNRCRRTSATPARARARARRHAHRRRLRTRRGSRPVAVQAVGVTAGNVRTSRSIAPPTSVVVIVMSPTVITLGCSAVTHVPSATAIAATSNACHVVSFSTGRSCPRPLTCTAVRGAGVRMEEFAPAAGGGQTTGRDLKYVAMEPSFNVLRSAAEADCRRMLAVTQPAGRNAPCCSEGSLPPSWRTVL